MKNLEKLLKRQLNLPQIPKWIPTVLLVVALIGFGDATYLTVKHFQDVIPPCSIGGCESVLTSGYSEIAGIPVSLGGVIFYMIMAIGAFLFLDTKKEKYLRFVSWFSFAGFLASLWFVFLMVFVIKAFCPYCAVSALTSFTLFGLSVYILRK